MTESMLARLIEPEIKQYLQKKNYKDLRESLLELEPVDIAEALMALEPDERAVVFRILPKDLAADVFEYIPFSEQESLVLSLNQEQVASILNEMDPDDRTAFLGELPATVTRRLIELLKPKERTIATQLLGYPEYSIGRRMTPEYVSIRKDWTVPQVFEHIRRVGPDKETLNVLYVVDEKHHLLDEILLKDVIFAEPDKIVADLMNEQVVSLQASDEQETAANVMRRYDITVLPVVDSDNALVGIITADDVFDVVEEETTEDMHRMGGLEALDEPYSQASMLTMVRKRLGWLSLLFVGGMLTIWAMEYFEDTMNQVTALAFFIPLIISSGGNSGSQASTLVIRALAVHDIQLRDWYRVAGREIAMGIMMGVALGVIAFLRATLLPGSASSLGDHYILIGLTVSLAVVAIVLFGSLTGCLLPFILRRVGIDPALSSAPLVATLMDVTGVIIYFSVAKLILGGILL